MDSEFSIKTPYTQELYKAKDITILDVKQKSMTFLLNGKVLGYPRNIDVKTEEIDLLCPCVDIWNHGDKMSLVKDFCDWR